MRLAVVGPVAPYRSGIAIHTTALVGALAAHADVEVSVLSFKRQYPRWLYPGADDRGSDTRPPAAPTSFEIDSLSPSTWRRAVQEIERFGADAVIVPAWTFFVAPALGWIARACRRRGIRVVMVVHNASDHESATWKARLSRFQLRQSSAFITHNTALADAVRRTAGGRPVAVHPHPIYDHYPEPSVELPRKAGLELLFFGLVRPYKGLDVAIRALGLMQRLDVRLRIVGEFWEGRAAVDALIEQLGLADRVEMIPRYVSDSEAANHFARADAVVLPYRTVTGSGVVPVAYRYGKPVIVTDLPGLSDVVRSGTTGWVVPCEDPAALARLLDTEVSAAAAERMRPAIAAARSAMSWDSFAAALVGIVAAPAGALSSR